MATTAFIYSPEFLKHDPPFEHPENPGRLLAIVERLRRTGVWDQLTHLPFEPAEVRWLETIHDPKYVAWVQDACARGRPLLDYGDTYAAPESYETARLAVGGLLAAARAIAEGRVRNAFCAVRPPGHHAERGRAMGFCIFNNIAIATRYVQRAHGLERVLIVDWDVHHGNGTQHAFEDDPSVYYVSLHQYPHYPGTGREWEVGTGEGIGYTRNVPMRPGAGDDSWLQAFESQLPAIAEDFRPDIILVSAGYDAHEADRLANINLSNEAYRRMARTVRGLADDLCAGRLLATLEGGYEYDALAECVEITLKVWLGEDAARG